MTFAGDLNSHLSRAIANSIWILRILNSCIGAHLKCDINVNFTCNHGLKGHFSLYYFNILSSLRQLSYQPFALRSDFVGAPVDSNAVLILLTRGNSLLSSAFSLTKCHCKVWRTILLYKIRKYLFVSYVGTKGCRISTLTFQHPWLCTSP